MPANSVAAQQPAPARDAMAPAASADAARILGSSAAPVKYTALPNADLASPSAAVTPLPLEDPKAQAAISASVQYLAGGKGTNGVAASPVSSNFKASQAMVDDLGMTHVRLDRTQDGLRVFGEQVITHLDQSGKVIDATGADVPPMNFASGAQGAPQVTAEKALATAQKDLPASFGGSKDAQVTGQPELMYFKAADGQYHKAYHLELTDLENGTKPVRASYMIDAQTGKVLDKGNLIDGFYKPIDSAAKGVKASGSKAAATDSQPVEIQKTATPKAKIADKKTVTSKIQVTDEATIDDVKFSVDATHANAADLTAFLTAPDGTKVQLLNRDATGKDWKVSSEDLAQFNGKSAKGTWTLTVTDNSKNKKTGTLNSWGLDIKGHNGNPPPPPPPPADGGTGHSLYSGDVKLQTTQNKDGTWSLIDGSRSGGKTLDALNKDTASGDNEFHDKNNVWGETGDDTREKAAIDAHYGMEMTWDFYKNVLGRSSIDGKGEALNSYVHLSKNYVNAYWDGKQMQYGDGDGKDAGPLTGLDIAGHEISHGLTERTANLVYSGESGGLNEAISDIMGKGVEWYAAQQNPSVKFSWAVGASVWTPNDNDPTDGLRYMNDPTKDGYSLDNYKNYASSDQEVHRTSGIANNAFFLMVQGGKNGTSGQGVDPSKAIGMDKALKIMYRAESVYMTPNTTFAQAAQAMAKAATDLYGASSQEAQTVAAAWKAVGVG